VRTSVNVAVKRAESACGTGLYLYGNKHSFVLKQKIHLRVGSGCLPRPENSFVVCGCSYLLFEICDNISLGYNLVLLLVCAKINRLILMAFCIIID
jgi:hypothetical protein